MEKGRVYEWETCPLLLQLFCARTKRNIFKIKPIPKCTFTSFIFQQRTAFWLSVRFFPKKL